MGLVKLARRPKEDSNRRERSERGFPSSQEESDIIREVGATPDEEGDLVIDRDQIEGLGAVDPASVLENRRMEEALKNQKSNKEKVSFNTENILIKYEWVLKTWPPNTLDIYMRRLTGAPIQHTITSHPRSGSELHAAFMEKHGQCEESKYYVEIFDNTYHVWRGKGQITLPDTRPENMRGSQPMTTPPGYPPGYGYPPQQGYPPPAPGYPPQQPVYPQQQPPPAPPGPDPNAMMGWFKQMWEMFQSTQPQPYMQPQHPPASQPAQPQQPYFVTPPASGPDPNAMMGWFKQMWEMFQASQPQQQTNGRTTPTANPMSNMNPMAMMGMMGMMPPAPQGMVWTPLGLVPMRTLVAAMEGNANPAAQRTPPTPSYRYGAPPQQPYGQPPPREKTPAETFQEMIGNFKTTLRAAREIGSMFPGDHAPPDPEPTRDDDDNPISVFEAGPAKIVVNKEDGSMRTVETIWANSDKIMKWMGEQHEAFQKAKNARESAKQRKVLAPGYVEVTPDYQPPPGFVAVPVDPQEAARVEQGLPPPPANIPPPIQTAPSTPMPWGIPSEREES